MYLMIRNPGVAERITWKFLKDLSAVPRCNMNAKQEKLEHLRYYLTQTSTAFKGHSIARFDTLILEQGTPFVASILAKTLKETNDWKKKHKPKSKECFYNAQMFVLTCNKGEYFEGYCYESIIPVHHAWIVIDGKVIDFTLEARDKSLVRQKIKSNSLESVYLGVSVSRKTIMQNIVKSSVAEPVAYLQYLSCTKV